MQALEIRTLTSETLPLFAQAFYDEWGYECRGDDELAHLISRWYAAKVSHYVTFSQLLLNDGELIGATLGSMASQRVEVTRWPERFNLDNLEEKIRKHPGSEPVCFFYRHLFEANENMRAAAAQRGRVFPAELLFLWVSSRHRGHGYSKRLLNWAMTTMKEAGATSFCLFTDTNCDVRFYERAPWVLEGESPWPDKYGMGGGKELMFSRSL